MRFKYSTAALVSLAFFGMGYPALSQVRSEEPQCQTKSPTYDSQHCVQNYVDCESVNQDHAAILKGGVSLKQLLETGVKCDKDHANASPFDVDSASQTPATGQTAEQFCASLQGTSSSCFPYSAHSASQFKKEADDLTEKINEANSRAVESEKNFQAENQGLTDHMNQQMLARISSLPASKNKETLAARQDLRNKNVALQTNFTALQGQFTQAQADYAKALSSIKDRCYKEAVGAYGAQKIAIDKLRAGNGVNVNSNRLTVLQSDLKTFQARSMQACLNNPTGIDAANQAGIDLANKKTQLDQQVADLNTQRANYNAQLATVLATLELEFKDKNNQITLAINTDQQKIMQLGLAHAAETHNQAEMTANLQKQFANAKANQACIEKHTGPVSSNQSDDSSDNRNAAILAAQDLVDACQSGKTRNDCNACSAVTPSLSAIVQSDPNTLSPSGGSATDAPPSDKVGATADPSSRRATRPATVKPATARKTKG